MIIRADSANGSLVEAVYFRNNNDDDPVELCWVCALSGPTHVGDQCERDGWVEVYIGDQHGHRTIATERFFGMVRVEWKNDLVNDLVTT